MAGGSITAANAIFFLAITNLFPVPQRLQGFAADDVFSTDALESAELLMGVDGQLSGGFVFVATRQSITLQADSPSSFMFDEWWSAQQVAKDLFQANGIVMLPSINRKATMNKGFLTSYPPIADAGKTLKPRKFTITWQGIIPALM